MADVVNRTTLERRQSVNTPEYPPEAWLINPEIPEGFLDDPDRFEVVGDQIVEKSPAALAELATARLLAAKIRRMQYLEAGMIAAIEEKYPAYRREKLAVMQTEAQRLGKTNRAAYLSQMSQWTDLATEASIEAYMTVMAAQTIEAVEAVVTDDAWLSLDPQVTLTHAMEIDD